MSQQNQNAKSSDETKSLHIAKFAHGRAESNTEFLAKDESPTLMIKRAAKAVVEKDLVRIVLPQGVHMTPEEMLGALSYCYAKGVFTSSEIEARMLKDTEFRQALKNEVPRPDILRKFRRLNHAAIIAVLEHFYLAERRKAAGARMAQPTSLPQPVAAAGDCSTTVFIAKRKASDRLNQVMFIDNMMREE